jgi:putative serine protease PepD
VEGSGPFNFGDFPNDPDDAAPEDEGPARAWLPPEDRLWRHPSEVALHGQPQGGPAPSSRPGRTTPRRDRRLAVTVGVVGVAAVATAVVVAFTVTPSPAVKSVTLTVASGANASFVTEPTAPAATDIASPLALQMVAALRPSLVAIYRTGGHRAAQMTGIVLAGGEMAVTSAAAVGKARDVVIVTAGGAQRKVKVLGSDPHSGIAVVSTGGGLTPAPFSEGNVEPGELAVAVCLCRSSAVAAATATDPSATVAVGEVRKVGTAATLKGGTGLVDTIEADMPVGPSPLGGVLLNAQGQVVGVLDARETTSSGRTGVFVPTSLALGVAQDLASSHKVDHGWLGITGTDAPDQGGARITSIMSGSPAASAGLRQGDVVEAVDSHAVDSLADLQASLYTSPPGTPVSVMLDRSGMDMMTTVKLATTPSG